MDFTKDLNWIAEAQCRKRSVDERDQAAEVLNIVEKTQTAYINGSVDFSNYSKARVMQGQKMRNVKMYDPSSPEYYLSIYLHRKLKKAFRVEFPNRNTYIRSLFNTVYALKNMSDYTIFKFDFRDFFNSVSSVYVYQKYIRGQGLERYQETLLEQYVTQTRYAYSGLCPSNVLCEIAAQHFDDLLNQSCSRKGLIYYRRYIDDGILIFNRFWSKDECLELVNRVIDKVFHERVDASPRCKVALKAVKTKYIARREITKASGEAVFDFLGYEFTLSTKSNESNNTDIKYGITKEKQDKYREKVRELMKHCADDPNGQMEFLRHQLKAFSQRTVYQVVRNKETLWINKGFLANYQELGNHLEDLSDTTTYFLKNVLLTEADAVLKKRPYFLNDAVLSQRACEIDNPVLKTRPYYHDGDSPESIYNLYHNLQQNKTQVFVPRIGIDKKKLRALCKQIGINPDPHKKYDSLLKAYLTRIGVGY